MRVVVDVSVLQQASVFFALLINGQGAGRVDTFEERYAREMRDINATPFHRSVEPSHIVWRGQADMNGDRRMEKIVVSCVRDQGSDYRGYFPLTGDYRITVKGVAGGKRFTTSASGKNFEDANLDTAYALDLDPGNSTCELVMHGVGGSDHEYSRIYRLVRTGSGMRLTLASEFGGSLHVVGRGWVTVTDFCSSWNETAWYKVGGQPFLARTSKQAIVYGDRGKGLYGRLTKGSLDIRSVANPEAKALRTVGRLRTYPVGTCLLVDRVRDGIWRPYDTQPVHVVILAKKRGKGYSVIDRGWTDYRSLDKAMVLAKAG